MQHITDADAEDEAEKHEKREMTLHARSLSGLAHAPEVKIVLAPEAPIADATCCAAKPAFALTQCTLGADERFGAAIERFIALGEAETDERRRAGVCVES